MAYPFDEMIAKIFLPCFHKHGESSFKFLINGNISSQAFLSVYKELEPIEKMEPVAKKNLKMLCIKMFPEKTPAEMITACKIIYTIGNITQYINEND